MNIVQIGCHTGNDHVYQFIQNNKCNNIILIDANPYAIEQCKINYQLIPNTIFINKAVVPEVINKTIKFYIPKNDTTSAHCSTSLDFIIRHNHAEWQEVDIECDTLDNILLDHNISQIDRLYIDAEGLDTKIICNLNFNKLNIEYLFFEYTHSDGPFIQGDYLSQASSKLISLGYSNISNDGFNLAFKK